MIRFSFPSKSKLLRYIETVLTCPPLFSYQYFRSRLFTRKIAWDSMTPCVFVLSTGRCGTQTLAALLGLSKRTLSLHSPWPRLGQLSRLAYEQGVLDEGEAFIEAFLIARKNLIQASAIAGKIYTETGPYNTFLAPVIRLALPKTRFIHLVRNPIHVVASAMQRKWYVDNTDDFTRIRPRSVSTIAWDQFNILQKNAWLWAETNRWIMDYCDTLPPEQYLRLHAEDIFAGKADTVDQLFSFMSIPNPSQNRIRRVLQNRLNASDESVVPSDDTAEIIWSVTYEVALKLGYSSSTRTI